MIFTKTLKLFMATATATLLALPAIVSAAGWSCGDNLHFDYGKGDGCEAITSPDANLAWLRAGNMNFIENSFGNLTSNSDAARRSITTSKGQKPKTIILTCSDSRVPPEILFNKGLGEIFIIRVAGNVIAKHEIGSIEYGTEHLGANLIIVLGHERCGAVKTTYDVYGTDTTALGPNLNSLINSILPSVDAVLVAAGGKALDTDPVGQAGQVEECVVENIKMVAESLEAQSAIVKEFVELGRLRIVTAKYDLDDGIVSFFPSTEAATPVTATTTTLHGIINDNREDVTTLFEYGTTSAYGTVMNSDFVPAGTDATEISAGLIGLSCNTTYHYRAVGESTYGTTYGNDKTFTTAACASTATSLDYSGNITGATFTVYRSTPGGTQTAIYSGPSTSYIDSEPLLPNTIYTYAVESDTIGQIIFKTIRTPLYNGWNIVGIPYNTVAIPLGSLFSGAINAIFEWVPAGSSDPDNNGSYVAVTQLLPGKAYFVKASGTTSMVAYTGAPNTLPVQVTLKPGWTLISNPAISNMTDVGTSWLIDGNPLNDAITANTIGADLYWWNGITYDSWKINDLLLPANSAVIEPWKGYWILNNDTADHTLTIQ